MEVQIISKSCVAPSSPTPPHLKTYKISLFDQFPTHSYYATVLFYKNFQETTKNSVLLSQSLSETLSNFYPLAGKIKDGFSIDCNDEGVCYVEAESNISLSQYLTHPDIKSLNKLLPNISTGEIEPPSGSHVALIQQTTFACGGFSIGIYISHMVCDGNSLFWFLKDWAAATATASKSAPKHLFLDGESIFPQYTAFPREAGVGPTIYPSFAKMGKYRIKRVVFSESTIADLKAKASSNNINNPTPTRVEVVTSLLSKCLMSSFKKKTGVDTSIAVTHVVNVRRKMEPKLPERSLGNFIRFVGALFSSKEEELSELVNQLRNAIKKVDYEFLNKLKNVEDGFFTYYDAMKEMRDLFTCGGGAVESVGFTSWCNFGIYEIDFGWGKPIWAACSLRLEVEDDVDIPFFNMILLTDTRIGKGVEAWISLGEDDFAFLEKNVELLQYASIDPSPIDF